MPTSAKFSPRACAAALALAVAPMAAAQDLPLPDLPAPAGKPSAAPPALPELDVPALPAPKAAPKRKKKKPAQPPAAAPALAAPALPELAPLPPLEPVKPAAEPVKPALATPAAPARAEPALPSLPEPPKAEPAVANPAPQPSPAAVEPPRAEPAVAHPSPQPPPAAVEPPPPAPALAQPAPAAAAPVAPPRSDAPPPLAIVAPGAKPAERARAFFAALRLGLLVPAGKPAGVVANPDLSVPLGHRVSTIPVSLQAGYRLPWLDRMLAIVAEGGWYPLSSKGSRALPQDPDFGTVEYSFKGHQVPLLLGLQAELPWRLFGDRLGFHGGASFTAVYARYQTTYSLENVQDAVQSGWAYGPALTGGGALRLGPGHVLLEARWTNARTDLRLRDFYASQPFNASKGDVVGMSYLAGYRLDF